MRSGNEGGHQIAVVTGGARGLGFEIVRQLSSRGYTVVAADLDAGAVRGAHDGDDRVRPARLDVRDADACAELAEAVTQEHGALDVWVNNAGILPTGPSWEIGAAPQRAVIEVNALGTVHGTLAALAQMRPVGHGAIVNVVSLAGLAPVPGMAAYSASKHAALAWSLSTLGELRAVGERNISISCLCPAGIWTPMLQDKTDDFWASAPFGGRLLAPEDVAARAVRLIDRPRPVACMPWFMGPVSRLVAASPRLATVLTPMVMRAAAAQRRRTVRALQG
ncbi:MAG TPA: SDR family NAD(P)-dependent oxidoreductase [Frankiaceae bacterium]|nr:SDR family NAD(P)-dependent oxidoreductase [Frankiaceae bacterium]